MAQAGLAWVIMALVQEGERDPEVIAEMAIRTPYPDAG
jgi:hypothetical protein